MYGSLASSPMPSAPVQATNLPHQTTASPPGSSELHLGGRIIEGIITNDSTHGRLINSVGDFLAASLSGRWPSPAEPRDPRLRARSQVLVGQGNPPVPVPVHGGESQGNSGMGGDIPVQAGAPGNDGCELDYHLGGPLARGGLTNQEIDGIEQLVRPIDTTQMDDLCGICLESIKARPACQTVCGHTFHQGCIRTAARFRRYCPNCRHVLSQKFSEYDGSDTESEEDDMYDLTYEVSDLEYEEEDDDDDEDPGKGQGLMAAGQQIAA